MKGEWHWDVDWEWEDSPLYELCPDCGGEGAYCLTCFDKGLIEHHCGESV